MSTDRPPQQPLGVGGGRDDERSFPAVLVRPSLAGHAALGSVRTWPFRFVPDAGVPELDDALGQQTEVFAAEDVPFHPARPGGRVLRLAAPGTACFQQPAQGLLSRLVLDRGEARFGL